MDYKSGGFSISGCIQAETEVPLEGQFAKQVEFQLWLITFQRPQITKMGTVLTSGTEEGLTVGQFRGGWG